MVEATIKVPNLVRCLEQSLRSREDTWDDKSLHISDLAAGIGEGCLRGVWLRLRGADKQPPTMGKLLMFDHGRAIHKRLVEYITPHLTGGWKLRAVEGAVALPGYPINGRFDYLLVSGEHTIVTDFKTSRGRAFSYLERAKPSHVIQVQGYMMGVDADGGLIFYVDREGQNACKQFYVERNDDEVKEAIERVCDACKSETPPPILEPQLKVAKNKGPDSVK